MVRVRIHCEYNACSRRAYYNYRLTTGVRIGVRPVYCRTHRLTGMVNVCQRSCKAPNCSIEPCFNYENEKVPIFCSKHKSPTMVDIKNKKCDQSGCQKQPSFRSVGSKNGSIVRLCAEHRIPGMICYRKWYKTLSKRQRSPVGQFTWPYR